MDIACDHSVGIVYISKSLLLSICALQDRDLIYALLVSI